MKFGFCKNDMNSWHVLTWNDMTICVAGWIILEYWTTVRNCGASPSLDKSRSSKGIQKSFTRKIKLDQQQLDYWEHLKVLKLYSQEHRRERYRIMYVWKILENVVPPIHRGEYGGTKLHTRNGRTMALPLVNPKAIQKKSRCMAQNSSTAFRRLSATIRLHCSWLQI